MILTKVKPFGHTLVSITVEFLSVEITYKVFCCTATERTSRIDIDNHHPFHLVLVTVNRQLDEIRTFKLIGLYTVSFTKLAQIFPVLQIRRRIETHVLVGRNNHIPFLGRFIPENFRITEVLQSVKRSQNRILFIFRISTSVVSTVSHTLDLSVFVTGRSIERNHGILSITGTVVFVNYRTSGENMSQSVARNSRIQMIPMNQVFAD